jgi:hypothetical protein
VRVPRLSGLIPSTFLARRRDVDRVGPFNESIRTGGFIEWFSRAKDAGMRPIIVSEMVCRRHIIEAMSGPVAVTPGRDCCGRCRNFRPAALSATYAQVGSPTFHLSPLIPAPKSGVPDFGMF